MSQRVKTQEGPGDSWKSAGGQHVEESSSTFRAGMSLCTCSADALKLVHYGITVEVNSDSRDG